MTGDDLIEIGGESYLKLREEKVVEMKQGVETILSKVDYEMGDNPLLIFDRNIRVITETFTTMIETDLQDKT